MDFGHTSCITEATARTMAGEPTRGPESLSSRWLPRPMPRLFLRDGNLDAVHRATPFGDEHNPIHQVSSAWFSGDRSLHFRLPRRFHARADAH